MPFLGLAFGFVKSWWREFAIGALVIGGVWLWHAHDASEQRLGALAAANKSTAAALAAQQMQAARNDVAGAALQTNEQWRASTTQQIEAAIAAASTTPAPIPLPSAAPGVRVVVRTVPAECPGPAVRAAVAGILSARAQRP